jgi:hypothetical protein
VSLLLSRRPNAHLITSTLVACCHNPSFVRQRGISQVRQVAKGAKQDQEAARSRSPRRAWNDGRSQ